VQIFDPTRAYSATIGGTCGPEDYQLCRPQGLTIGSGDVLYVADTMNTRVQVYQLVGHSMVFSQSITLPGPAEDRWVPGVAVDANYLYVIETGWDNRVHVFSRSGVYSSTIEGHCWDEDPWFCAARDVAVDSKGNVYVADPFDYSWMTKCSGGPNWTCTPFAGTQGVPYLTDDRHFNSPAGVAVVGDSLFVVEGFGHRLLRLDTSGEPQWTVGVAGVDGSDNDHFEEPSAVAVDSNYRSYVADMFNHRVQIFNSDGSYYTTLGDGDCNPDDGIGHTEFCEPQGVAIGPGNAIYVADTGNHRVQIFNSDGSYYTTLGTPGEPGDDNDHFAGPVGVTVDSSNIYVADTGNRRVQIFDSNLAYKMTLGPTGDGYFFGEPWDVAVDNNSGRIYVGDHWGWILVFDSNGDYLTRIWGAGGESVDVDSAGNIYADADCHCIQKFAPDSDGDGSPDSVEDGAPNGGDGNNDGIPDRDQNNVASLPNAVDSEYVTLASPDGTSLSDVHAVGNPSPGDAPPGVDFPVGFFEFTVVGIAPGGNATVTLLPGKTVDTYYKYGPTPGNSVDHWYEFLFDGTTGADIFADRVVLHFVDGQRGDNDLDANGEVVEPGSPGLRPTPNQPPTVGTIIAPVDPVQVGTEVNVNADFTDPDSMDTHTAVWDWGDGTTTDSMVANYTVSGSHIYMPPGVYTIQLTVRDSVGGAGSAVYQFVVVYDPEGGFVTLVVAGARAQFKGTGTINGAGDYGFMLTAIDAELTPSTDADKFRIKIWDRRATDQVVYDNQMNATDDADPTTVLGGGAIVIHKAK
jgi:hypothetical protein